MTKSTALFAALSATAMFAHAKTVLWYHFDEAEPGTVTTADSIIVDAAGTQNGSPEYYWNGGKSSSTTYMPAYSNAFPNGCLWFDPVSGQRGSLNRCLHIQNPPLRGEWGNGEHGIVRIPDNEKFHLQTFTIEMFVKDLYLADPAHTEVRNRSTAHNVLSKKNSWALYIPGGNGNGSDAVSKSIYRSVDGAATSWSDGVNANFYPRTQRDGNWHHVAYVVDGSDQSAVKVGVYVDYVLQYNAEKTMVGPIYYDASDIYLGMVEATGNNGWGGLMDEFRISDAALAPAEMLRIVNPRADDDTLLYLAFDNWLGNLFKNNPCGAKPNTYLINEAGLVEAAVPVLARRSTETPLFPTDAMGNLKRDIASVATPDTCSFQPIPNGYHQGLGITYPLTGERIVTKNDFSVEMLVKYPQLPSVDEYLMRNYSSVVADEGNKKSWYIIAGANGKVSFNVNWSAKGVTTKEAVLADGAWHHIAWTVDKAMLTSSFYVDYKKVGEITDAALCPIAAADLTDAGTLLFCSYEKTGWNGNSFTGYLDELRVTGRRLEPQEFLTTRAASSDVLASASFENDLAEGPSDYADLFAAGTLEGSGAFAKSRPFKTDTNKTSIRLDAATVNLGRNILLEQGDAFTLEFCLRPESLSGAASIVALMKPAPSDEALWSVALAADAASLTVTAGEGAATFALPVLADWWHHYGLVFAKGEQGPTVTLFVDHVQIGEPTALPAAFGSAARSRALALGSDAFTGWFDELRITRGALAPEEMMSASPRVGALLLLR